MTKKIISILMCIVLMMPSVVFADDPFSTDKSYELISNASKTVLSVLAWFGYAIALGILIWIGIKYMLSTANEKANLKGTVKMYLIGVSMIFLCSTIAKSVADIASSVGDNSAEGIVDKGFGFAGLEVGNISAELGDLGDMMTYKYAYGNIILHARARVDIEYIEGEPPKLIAPEMVRGRKFMYWTVREMDTDGNILKRDYNVYERTLELTGAYRGYKGANRKYEVWAVYEGDEKNVELARLEQDLINNIINNGNVGENNGLDVPPLTLEQKLEAVKTKNTYKELLADLKHLLNGKKSDFEFDTDYDPNNIFGDEENPEIINNAEKDKAENPSGLYRPTVEDLAGIN